MKNSASLTEEVVITGAGLVSPFGIGLDEHIEEQPVTASGSSGRVPDFDLDDYLPSKKPYLDRNTKLGLLAAALAMGEAGFEQTVPFPAESALAVSTAFGNHASLSRFSSILREKGIRLASPLIFPHTYLNATASMIAIEFGLRGTHLCFCDGCVGSCHSVWAMWHDVRRGRSRLAVSGGIDYVPDAFSAPAPTESHLSEGAAFLLMESLGSSTERDAEPYCSIVDVSLMPEKQMRDPQVFSVEPGTAIVACNHEVGRILEETNTVRESCRVSVLPDTLGETSARTFFAIALCALCLHTGKVPAALDGLDGVPEKFVVVDCAPPVGLSVVLKSI